VQANAYSTPASSRGFGVHHDTHDVLVLQVAGRKRWRLYEPLLELPLKTQRWSAQLGDPGEPVDDVTLDAGDTLYLPRGWSHEAVAADADSLHITVGLHPHTRIDALRDALSECADDVEFRRALEPGGELPPELLERLAARLRPDAVASRARRRFVDSWRPILGGQLGQLRALEELELSTPLQRRPTVIADLEATDRGVTLRFEGKEVRFPPQAAAAVRFAHASPARSARPSCPARSTRRAGWCSSGGSFARGFCGSWPRRLRDDDDPAVGAHVDVRLPPPPAARCGASRSSASRGFRTAEQGNAGAAFGAFPAVSTRKSPVVGERAGVYRACTAQACVSDTPARGAARVAPGLANGRHAAARSPLGRA
jgi:hypothetical protein